MAQGTSEVPRPTWFARRVQSWCDRDRMKLSERAGDVAGVVVLFLLAAFFVYQSPADRVLHLGLRAPGRGSLLHAGGRRQCSKPGQACNGPQECRPATGVPECARLDCGGLLVLHRLPIRLHAAGRCPPVLSEVPALMGSQLARQGHYSDCRPGRGGQRHLPTRAIRISPEGTR